MGTWATSRICDSLLVLSRMLRTIRLMRPLSSENSGVLSSSTVVSRFPTVISVSFRLMAEIPSTM